MGPDMLNLNLFLYWIFPWLRRSASLATNKMMDIVSKKVEPFIFALFVVETSPYFCWQTFSIAVDVEKNSPEGAVILQCRTRCVGYKLRTN